MFDTESNPNREGCLPGDCWHVELMKTKEHFSTELPHTETSSSDPWLRAMNGHPAVRSTRQTSPVSLTLPVIKLPFHDEKSTRFLLMLMDGALIQLIELCGFVVLGIVPVQYRKTLL